MVIENKIGLAPQFVTLEYGSEREREILEWAEKSGLAQKAKTMMEKILGIEKTYAPLPGSVEVFRAWCLRKGIFKTFWKKM